jgi:hypothetical protein
MTPGIRRYANLPGSPPSVTSIIGLVWPRPDLERWKQNTIAELARRHLRTDVERLLRDHGPRGDLRGTAVHKLIAAHLATGEAGQHSPDGEVQRFYDAWAEWWAEQRLEIVGVEHTLADPDRRWAGTADLLAMVELSDGHRLLHDGLVIDWKTCQRLPERPWPEHVAQVAAYARMAGAKDGGQAWQGSVVYISPDDVGEWWYSAEDLVPHYEAFEACYRVACHLYPELKSDPQGVML